MAKVLDFELEKSKVFCDKWIRWSRENRDDLGDFADNVVEFMENIKSMVREKEQQKPHSCSGADS